MLRNLLVAKWLILDVSPNCKFKGGHSPFKFILITAFILLRAFFCEAGEHSIADSTRLDSQVVKLKKAYNTSINRRPLGLLPLKQQEYKTFKGIEDIGLQKYLIYSAHINELQRGYSRYATGMLNLAQLKTRFSKFGADLSDTTNYIKTGIINTIDVITGTNKRNERIIIVDTNHNKDFSDDRKVILKESSLLAEGPDDEHIPLTVIPYQRASNKVVISDSLVVKAIPFKGFFDNYSNKLEAELQLALQDSQYKYAYLAGINKYVFIKMSSPVSMQFYEKRYALVALSTTPTPKQRLTWRHFDEDVPLSDGEYVRFTDLQHQDNSLTYINFKAKRSTGLNVGQFLPSHTFWDYKTNAKISISTGKTKYTLIDFWGTWCGPCIEAMPHLKNLYSKYATKKSLTFIGIAYDGKELAPTIDSILKKNNITWPTYIDDKNLRDKTFEKMYHVYTYPTVLIVDRTGKVIYRSANSENDLINLSRFLDTL